MKKRLTGLLLAMLMVLTACGGQGAASSSAAASSEAASSPAVSEPAQSEPVAEDTYVANVASMKGPTSIGMVQLMTSGTEDFHFEMFTEGSEIVPLVVKGEIDIALVPANLAATLYQKTQGGIQVIGINTLGVLEVVAPADVEIDSFDDLAGKTIYMTGKGTTPEYGLNYMLSMNNIDPAKDVTVEFNSEATEVAAALASGAAQIAVLPQPFVTAALTQNENLRVALSLTDEWAKVNEESAMLTGVAIVRKAFAEENPEAVKNFLTEYAASTEYVNANAAEAAEWIAELGIVAKAPLAQKAIPACNLTYIAGEQMRDQIQGYYQVLYQADPASIGGGIPDDAFYYGT